VGRLTLLCSSNHQCAENHTQGGASEQDCRARKILIVASRHLDFDPDQTGPLAMLPDTARRCTVARICRCHAGKCFRKRRRTQRFRKQVISRGSPSEMLRMV